MKKISRSNTHKKNIIDNIISVTGIPSSYVKILLDDLMSILIYNSGKNNCIKIHNFGTFNLRSKKERIGRNPKNKNSHLISERNVLTFKASLELNKKINADIKK